MLIFVEVSFLELLGEGLVQIAFLSSQSSLFWPLHVVLKYTADWFLRSSGCFFSSTLYNFILLSSLLSLFCASSGTRPRGFSCLWSPAVGGCPGLHQPLSDFTQRLIWFGVASTSAVLATVLKVAPALSCECLWVIIKVLLFSGQVHGSVAFFYFFHNILMIDRSCVSCFFCPQLLVYWTCWGYLIP